MGPISKASSLSWTRFRRKETQTGSCPCRGWINVVGAVAGPSNIPCVEYLGRLENEELQPRGDDVERVSASDFLSCQGLQHQAGDCHILARPDCHHAERASRLRMASGWSRRRRRSGDVVRRCIELQDQSVATRSQACGRKARRNIAQNSAGRCEISRHRGRGASLTTYGLFQLLTKGRAMRRRLAGSISRALGETPIGYFPVRVRAGLAKGARWTFLPFSSYWRAASSEPMSVGYLLLSTLEGLVFWDCGAHFGIHTVGMSNAYRSEGTGGGL